MEKGFALPGPFFLGFGASCPGKRAPNAKMCAAGGLTRPARHAKAAPEQPNQP
jgi:hypothetical protein